MKSLKPSDIVFNPLQMPGGRPPQLRTIVPQVGGAYGRTYAGYNRAMKLQKGGMKIARPKRGY
jgi:hypothetical protein